MDILIYFIVVILSFYIGRCSGLDKREFKRINKIGRNPSPNYPKPQRLRGGYQPSISSVEQLKNIKPPNTGSEIR